MNEQCDRETCYCCGRGHWCEPPDYPTEPAEWTCPECGTEYATFNPLTESVRPLPESIRKHLTPGRLGWTQKAAR